MPYFANTAVIFVKPFPLLYVNITKVVIICIKYYNTSIISYIFGILIVSEVMVRSIFYLVFTYFFINVKNAIIESKVYIKYSRVYFQMVCDNVFHRPLKPSLHMPTFQ